MICDWRKHFPLIFQTNQYALGLRTDVWSKGDKRRLHEVFTCIARARHSLATREVKHLVYVKRQTRICTTWPSFLFTCRLLFIISTHKLVVSRNFLSIRIVLSCFYLLIFYVEKFSTWIWRLPFAVYVKLKLSTGYVYLLWVVFGLSDFPCFGGTRLPLLWNTKSL